MTSNEDPGFNLESKEDIGFSIESKEEAGFSIESKEDAGFDLSEKEPEVGAPKSSNAQSLPEPRSYQQMVSDAQPSSTTSFRPDLNASFDADPSAKGPVAASLAALTNSFNFSGRASRSEYWWFAAMFFGAYLATLVIEPMLAVILFLVCFVGLWSAGVRRLHDLDKSGWLILVAYIPLGNILLIYWFCQDGQQQANRFGPPATKY